MLNIDNSLPTYIALLGRVAISVLRVVGMEISYGLILAMAILGLEDFVNGK